MPKSMIDLEGGVRAKFQCHHNTLLFKYNKNLSFPLDIKNIECPLFLPKKGWIKIKGIAIISSKFQGELNEEINSDNYDCPCLDVASNIYKITQ